MAPGKPDWRSSADQVQHSRGHRFYHRNRRPFPHKPVCCKGWCHASIGPAAQESIQALAGPGLIEHEAGVAPVFSATTDFKVFIQLQYRL